MVRTRSLAGRVMRHRLACILAVFVGLATMSPQVHAVVLYTVTDLGTLGGSSSWAYGINSSGQVVGRSSTSDAAYHAFLYDDSTMTDLGTLGGSESCAKGINSSGQVVGYSYLAGDTTRHAFLYSDETMIDLNSLIDPGTGWTLDVAQAINDAEQIVGYGVHNGYTHAFLLTPVPEPGTWAMLAGLAFFGLLAAFRTLLAQRAYGR